MPLRIFVISNPTRAPLRIEIREHGRYLFLELLICQRSDSFLELSVMRNPSVRLGYKLFLKSIRFFSRLLFAPDPLPAFAATRRKPNAFPLLRSCNVGLTEFNTTSANLPARDPPRDLCCCAHPLLSPEIASSISASISSSSLIFFFPDSTWRSTAIRCLRLSSF